MLGWELVTAEATAYDSHHFQTQTIQIIFLLFATHFADSFATVGVAAETKSPIIMCLANTFVSRVNMKSQIILKQL